MQISENKETKNDNKHHPCWSAEYKQKKAEKIRQQALLHQEQIMNFSGLKVDQDIHAYDVPVLGTEWIHTVQAGYKHKDKTPMLVLHGFGGSNVLFFKMVKDLAQHRMVYFIDLPGFGLSSRPEYVSRGPEGTLNYLLDWLEDWRVHLKLEKLIIVGHSFGGFLAGHYALRHPEVVERLHAISPIGVTYGTSQDVKDYEEGMTKDMNWMKKWLFGKAKDAFYDRETPGSMYQKWWTPSKMFLNRFIRNRIHLKDAEADSFLAYYSIVYDMKVSCEKAFSELFMFPKLLAHQSLQESMPTKLKCKVHFYYGDHDWMDTKGARELFRNNQLQEGSSFDIIPESGHQVPADNPTRLSELINKYNEVEEVQVQVSVKEEVQEQEQVSV